jgi:SAM-dependent methyltransferase
MPDLPEITLEHGIATVFILAVLMIGTVFVFSQYRRKRDETDYGGNGGGARNWLDFSVEALGGFSYVKLALVSIFGLFLEMLLIRWVSCEIRIFAYFKNFVLIACYLGFGLGCYLCRRRIHLLAMLVPLVLLTFLIELPWPSLRYMVDRLPACVGIFGDVDIWGVPKTPIDGQSLLALATAIAFMVPIFALLTFVFIPVGQFVGWYLEKAPHGILGYTVNILGSLGGILLYSALCFAYQPPTVWFVVSGLILLPLLWRLPRQAAVAMAAFALCIGLISLRDQAISREFWSPYQKLVLEPRHTSDGELIEYSLTTNNSWYQRIVNLSPAFVAKHKKLLQGVPIEYNSYNLPYRFYPNSSSTLVLGSGMGNDVAAALRNGSRRVVAVEIDPMILDLGKRFHFEKPYDSPRVVRVTDDARSYLQNSTDSFDLINFSLLDSHTTASHFSNIRIDNYVYTVEALQAAKKLLKPDGVFVVKFQTNKPWIAGRLSALLTEAFGHPPVEFEADRSYSTTGRFYVTGSEKRIKATLADRKFAEFVRTHGGFLSEPAPVTTDDWPFFYQQGKGVPTSVIVISIVLALLSLVAVRRIGTGVASMQWHFFFLGAGFLLMEVQIISKIALLFGTTWMVNSIVISGLLMLIVAANIIAAKLPPVPVAVAYTGLFLSIAVGWLVPAERLFFANPWLRGVAATGFLCLPVFFAGLIFIRSFAQVQFSSAALGSNLLGALVGGLLESLSLWLGLKALLLIAALLYFLSLLTRRSAQPARAAKEPSGAQNSVPALAAVEK